MKKNLIAMLAMLLCLGSASLHAATLTYTVAQLNADFERARRDGYGMPRLSNDIEKIMNDLTLSVDGVKFVSSHSKKEGGCSHNWGYQATGMITISPSSNIQFVIDSLAQPVVATVDLSGNVDANGKLHGSAGFRVFGKCVRYISGQANVSANANLSFWVSVTLRLNPQWDPVNRTITLTPSVQVAGKARKIYVAPIELSASLGLINPPLQSLFGLMPESAVDQLLQGLVNAEIANVYLDFWLREQNIKIAANLQNNGYSSIVMRLPAKEANEAQNLGLLNWTNYAFSYPVPASYIALHSNDLFYAAVINDRAAAREILAGAAACTATGLMRNNVSMIRTPIYQKVGTACQSVVVTDSTSGTFFSDSLCSVQNIQLRNMVDLCNEHTQADIMGNPASWGAAAVAAETKWTYSYMSQLPIAYDDLTGKTIPFFKRVAFKKIVPAKHRNLVGIYDAEARLAAIADCNTKYRYMAWGSSADVPYCLDTLTKDKFYRGVSNNVGSTIFNNYKFSIDVSACISSLTGSYLASPGSYNYKYGISYTYGAQIPADGQKMIANDCRKQVAETAGAAERFALEIDGDGSTKTTDAALHASYVSQCAQNFYGPPDQHKVTVNGKLLACYPVLTLNDPAFLLELEKPLLRGNGSCLLEMRVFKKNPNATGLKPLIMFHGGAWNVRAAGFAALEPEITYYTEKGYVVFAPFYRIAGERDANVECNGSAASEMTQDAMDAYTWVKTNGHVHGAIQNAKPLLFGQSAGAYFAAFVAGKTTSSDIAKVLLMYPPTDPVSYAADYKKRYDAWLAVTDADIKAKGYRTAGDDGLEAFMDASLDWSLSSDSATRQKYYAAAAGFALPDLLKYGTGSHAPIYMMHGNVDRLVPAEQSVVLCNAMAGTNTASTWPGTYSCGQGSSLLMVDGAGHMLDLCLDPTYCSPTYRGVVGEALGRARTWFTTP